MRAFWWDGLFASVADSVLLNYLSLYLLAFGASASQVGLLSSLSSLFASLAFFPGARLAERVASHKRLVLVTGGGIARLSLLALAAVPFVTSGSAGVWLVIALASFRGFWGYFAMPAWTALTAEVVPSGMRGRYLASRNFGMGLASLAMMPIAGFLIDRYSGLSGWQVVWVVAFVAGALSTLCYARIPEPARRRRAVARPESPGFFREIAADRNFALYLVSVIVWNLGLNAAGPFFNVYLVSELHASTSLVGIIAAIPAITGLAGTLAFGRLMDRFGTKWVMVLNGLLIPLLPLAWVAVTAAWQVTFINLFGGIIWAGYGLATTNMVMVMAPADRRARYAAAFHTATFLAAFAGPLLGGLVIDYAGFKAVFLLSAAGRMVGTALLLRFVSLPHRASLTAA